MNLADILADIYGLLDEEEYDTALDAINNLLISHPDSFAVLLCKSHILFAQRHFDRAEEVIREALSIAPEHARVHFALLKILQIRGNFAEAEAVFATMLTCPDFADTIDVASYATQLLATGHGHDALVVLERGVYLRPMSIHLRIIYGDMLRQHGQIDDAAQVYTEALQLAPENGLILHRLGELEYERGNFTIALSHFQTAVQRHPTELHLRIEYTHALLMVSFPVFRRMHQLMVYPDRKLHRQLPWLKIGLSVVSPLIVAALLAAVHLPLAELIVWCWLWGIGATIALIMFVTAWVMLLRPVYVTLLWLQPAYRPHVAYHFADGVAALEWSILFISVLVLLVTLPSLGSEHAVSRVGIGVLCASILSIAWSYGLRVAHDTTWFIRVGLAYGTLIISIYMIAVLIAVNSMDQRLKIVAGFLFLFGMISLLVVGDKAQNAINTID